MSSLSDVVAEIEAHADASGWDQSPRIYALVPTDELLAREPALATTLGVDTGTAPGTLTPVEDQLDADTALEEALPRLMWPREVVGCAVVVERLVLPPEAEEDVPTDPTAAGDFAAAHPLRQEVRIAAGVLRDGRQHCALRIRSGATDPLQGSDLVPSLTALLHDTLSD